MMTPLALAGTAVTAFGIAWFIAGRVHTFGLIDHPNERSSHTLPTPRGGGIAITFVTVAAFVAMTVAARALPGRMIAAYASGALVLSIVSLIDDAVSLGAGIRLAGQAIGATIVVATCGYGTLAFGRWSVEVGVAGAVMTIVWIIGLTNVYNFMDGIDGIAGGQAVMAAAGWAVIGALNNEKAILVLAVLIASTSLGFLRWNWPPARVFMGDVGSAFLGFSFAAIPLLAIHLQRGDLLFAAILSVWPFLFDATLTLIRRAIRRENILRAHRTHLYQRLVIAGYEHRPVTMLYILFAAESSGAAVASLYANAVARGAILVLQLLASVMLWWFVTNTERTRSGV